MHYTYQHIACLVAIVDCTSGISGTQALDGPLSRFVHACAHVIIDNRSWPPVATFGERSSCYIMVTLDLLETIMNIPEPLHQLVEFTFFE